MHALPTQPAAALAVHLPARRTPALLAHSAMLHAHRLVAFAFVVLASLGLACIVGLLADQARSNFGVAGFDVRAACGATLVVAVLGASLERIGAVEAWAVVARAMAFAPVWCILLFFRFYRPWPPNIDGIALGVLIAAVPVVAVLGAGRAMTMAKATPRRSLIALGGIALLWILPCVSEPVDVTEAPAVRAMLGSLAD